MDTLDIFFREPTVEDTEAVFDLFLETWVDTYINESLGITEMLIRNMYEPRDVKLAKRREAYQNPSLEKLTQIAVIDDTIVGICSINLVRNEIGALYVLPAHQRKGVGHGLFIWALDKLNHRLPITIEVADYNHKAIAFYQACGFTAIGKGSDHIIAEGTFIPCIKMARTIGK